ncbi:carbohydrate ABC transporter permease [Collimonas silvisoli]|uniref:carbohydrate ABC transporter permease n=1 Tax=Collimonas silvisoli TaxID=2825884 RepID=UPI001B8B51D6|nr:sugar ABC transporter permease [Collimonas silvisoli]
MSIVHEAGIAPAKPTAPAIANRLNQARTRTAWLFVAPLFIVLLLIAGWPLLRSIWFSVTDTRLNNLAGGQFIGLANYIGEYGVLQDPDWWNAVGNTLLFASGSVLLETLFGLSIAMMLNQPSRIRTLLRVAILVPWAIPTVVSAKIWAWMLHDQFGLINHLLLQAGMLSQPLAWTSDPHLAMLTIVLVDTWKTTPFMALLILAALQMLPQDLYEAARVDGIPVWTVFRKITLPLIMPGILVAMLFRALDALRVFDLIYVLTSNGKSTKSMSVYVREQLVDFQQVGYGSAAATLLFLMIALITVIYLTAVRSKIDEEN